jgi:hypothetical protein
VMLDAHFSGSVRKRLPAPRITGRRWWNVIYGLLCRSLPGVAHWRHGAGDVVGKDSRDGQIVADVPVKLNRRAPRRQKRWRGVTACYEGRSINRQSFPSSLARLHPVK